MKGTARAVHLDRTELLGHTPLSQYRHTLLGNLESMEHPRTYFLYYYAYGATTKTEVQLNLEPEASQRHHPRRHQQWHLRVNYHQN